MPVIFWNIPRSQINTSLLQNQLSLRSSEICFFLSRVLFSNPRFFFSSSSLFKSTSQVPGSSSHRVASSTKCRLLRRAPGGGEDRHKRLFKCMCSLRNTSAEGGLCLGTSIQLHVRYTFDYAPQSLECFTR